MKNNIEQYKELLLELWNNLEDDLIDESEYHNIKHDWLMKNGSEELFDYYINLYEGKPIAQEYINLKKEFLEK